MRRSNPRAARGQVLPVWIFGTLMLIAFICFAGSYAYTLSWQIRAQNAADSLAQALVAEQTEQFNQMQSVLYASSIEETRIRHFILALRLLAKRSGDCTYVSTYDGLCKDMYDREQIGFQAAVRRYTDDVELMAQVTRLQYNDHVQLAKDAIPVINGSPCQAATSPDCAFQYSLVNYRPRRDQTTGPWGVHHDALTLVPGQMGGIATEPKVGNTIHASFAPPEVEVLACATVPPFFKKVTNFFGLSTPRFTVAARSAATAAPVVSEWVSPGNAKYPGPQNFPYVSSDAYDVVPPVNDSARFRSDAWYDHSFDLGPSDWTPDASGVVHGIPNNNAFIVLTNWWQAVPISPYTGPQPVNAANDCRVNS